VGVARILIEGGADMFVKDDSLRSSLHWAVHKSRTEVGKYLAEVRNKVEQQGELGS
jgi:ankyrin repeat protein